MSGYILQTGERGRERLEILNDLVNHGFLSFVQQSGLKEGMRVLDIGCGMGILACEIAKLVGPTGRVLGIDISQEQIDQSRLLAEREKISNVAFRQMSAYDIGTLKEEFDLIYTRYILMHIKDPQSVVKSALALLAKEGVMICDERGDNNDAFFCEPQNNGYDAWVNGNKFQMRVQGSDNTFGMKLHRIFQELGYTSSLCTFYSPCLVTKREKKILRLAFEETAEKVIAEKLYTAEELQTIMKQLRAFEVDDRYFAQYCRFVRIAAKKK